jgi:CRISPR/Cas system endoribonuclease Cas6 (RAMP superfamily)
MRVLVVFIAFFFVSISMLIVADLLAGMTFREAINILNKSFYVMTIEELLILTIAFTIPFIIPLISLIKQKRKGNKRQREVSAMLPAPGGGKSQSKMQHMLRKANSLFF